MTPENATENGGFMKTKYLLFFLLFIILAGAFTFLRTPISDAVNTLLIAIGEGRSIRVDNTDMVKRKTEKQVKVKGAGGIARAAQIKVFKETLSAPPEVRLTEDKSKKKRSELFIADWAVLGPFDLSVIARRMNLQTVLKQECMNAETSGVSFQQLPEGMAWHQVQALSADGRIDLAEAFRKNSKAAAVWAAADIVLEQEYPSAYMMVGIQQFGRVFLNGKEVFVSMENSPARADGTAVQVQLNKGRNRIIVKAASSNARSWFFYLRFVSADKKIPLVPVKSAK